MAAASVAVSPSVCAFVLWGMDDDEWRDVSSYRGREDGCGHEDRSSVCCGTLAHGCQCDMRREQSQSIERCPPVLHPLLLMLLLIFESMHLHKSSSLIATATITPRHHYICLSSMSLVLIYLLPRVIVKPPLHLFGKLFVLQKPSTNTSHATRELECNLMSSRRAASVSKLLGVVCTSRIRRDTVVGVSRGQRTSVSSL